MTVNLWQLRKLSTNENLGEPQTLPEDWEGIFGLHGFIDRIHDLSWLGNPALTDLGWFETDIIDVSLIPIPEISIEDQVKNKAKSLLSESDWTMMPDVPITKGKKIEWMDYRRALREIKLQPGFPDDVSWPSKPE